MSVEQLHNGVAPGYGMWRGERGEDRMRGDGFQPPRPTADH